MPLNYNFFAKNLVPIINMTAKKLPELTSRRGFKKYEQNPSLSIAYNQTKSGVKRISNKAGDNCMIISEYGEIIAPAGFHQIVEVDKTQFIKLYVNGVKAFQGLSSAGTKVFELIYYIVQEKPSVDRIYIHFMNVDQTRFPLSERTFHRGVTELLTKEFIFESTLPNLYFINIDYMFNGNRLAFIKEYFVKEVKKMKTVKKIEQE
jgi:hypothetical protein